METILLFSILVIFKLTGVYCVECRETSLTSGSRSFSCLYGCCGEIYQRYCCPSDEEAFPIEVVKAGIGVVVVVVVVVIVLIVVFMCKKKTPRTRALVVPQNANVRTSTIPLSDTEYTLKPQTGQAEYQPPLSYPGGGVHTGPVVPAYTRSYNALPPPYNVSTAYNNTAIVPVN
ncbi:protein shisa-4-like [Haliotis rufescens]|uniref:protein shisa-4-like n=1 Tax=Haliotis rufescens TaxID=6454 RepID=UPI001EAFCDB2|nr:protein shisa-4-like [Haliotis rufescens]